MLLCVPVLGDLLVGYCVHVVGQRHHQELPLPLCHGHHSYQVQVLLMITWSQVRQVKVRVAVSASTLAPTSPPTGTAPAYLSSTDTSPSPWARRGVIVAS